MNVAALVALMEEIAPTTLAAAWDNVGLIVGDPAAELSRVLLAIDCTRSVVSEAIRDGCSAIVSYHPPIFEGQKRLVAGSAAFSLARAGIAVYSPHTALDAIAGGTNDALADTLAMTERSALRPIPRPAGAKGATGAGLTSAAGAEAIGFGRVGRIAPMSARASVDRVKEALGVEHVLVAGPLDRPVSRAAVCAGSGGSFVADAVGAGAELFLTGELRHHDALAAAEAGLTAICALHSVSERCALGALARRLAAELGGIPVVTSRADRDPFVIV